MNEDETAPAPWRVTETSTTIHVEHLDKGGFVVVSQQAGEWACTFLNTLEAEVERLREELEGIVNFRLALSRAARTRRRIITAMGALRAAAGPASNQTDERKRRLTR